MTTSFSLLDFIHPFIDGRLPKVGITEGVAVLGYGCRPGMDTMLAAARGGESGQVHAVDVHELADPSHRRRINRFGLKNAAPVLTVYHRFADLACAIGRVFANADPEAFLGEPRRSTRKGDVLAIDNGRQSRVTTKRQLAQGGRGAGHRPAPR